MSIEIKINPDQCTYSMYDPKGCKRCLQICPVAAFATRPAQKRDFSIPKEQRADPQRWVLLTPWEDACTGCGACVRACPVGALTVTIDSRPVS